MCMNSWSKRNSSSQFTNEELKQIEKEKLASASAFGSQFTNEELKQAFPKFFQSRAKGVRNLPMRS